MVKALRDVLQKENHSLNNSDITTIKKHLDSPKSKAFNVLGKAYQRKTKTANKLSKVRLGESIAKVLANEN